jgi:hypothetical protein
MATGTGKQLGEEAITSTGRDLKQASIGPSPSLSLFKEHLFTEH